MKRDEIEMWRDEENFKYIIKLTEIEFCQPIPVNYVDILNKLKIKMISVTLNLLMGLWYKSVWLYVLFSDDL